MSRKPCAAAVIIIACLFLSRCGDRERVVYEPRWESLACHETPAWFRDAKFGIYFHWGIYSVPAYGTEWYSRNMYREKRPEYKHHREKYGDQKEFGYKDFLPRFTAEKFDADRWAELFLRAGAKYAGPVTEHADGFAMWDSELTEWDAADKGPKRDIVGELARAVKKRGLKFITTFHHQWLWAWYPTYDERYDTFDPALSGLYGPKVPGPAAFKKPRPNAAFCRRWRDRVMEVVASYRPDAVYFDSRLATIGETYRKEMLAHYYTAAARWRKPVVVTYKNEDLPAGVAVRDVERGRMAELKDFPWQTDDSIDWKSWAHLENPQYKSTDRLIDELVDIVSKNGNLLLNITPRADGVIPRPVRDRLLAIGAWLDLNGEAIYGTRPWRVFGEGPTKVEKGHFGEKKIGAFGPRDIRFTTKGDSLYAIVLAWPEKQLRIDSINTAALGSGRIAAVELLGSDETVTWTIDDRRLTITLPTGKPCDHAQVFRITLK